MHTAYTQEGIRISEMPHAKIFALSSGQSPDDPVGSCGVALSLAALLATAPVAERRSAAFRGAELRTAAGGDSPRFGRACPFPGLSRQDASNPPERPGHGTGRHGPRRGRCGGRTCPGPARPQAPPPPPPRPRPDTERRGGASPAAARCSAPGARQRCCPRAARPPRTLLPLGMSSGSPGGRSGASGGGGRRRRRRRRRRGGGPAAATFAGGCRGGRCACSQRRQEQHVPRC